jgi:hypothetical protein
MKLARRSVIAAGLVAVLPWPAFAAGGGPGEQIIDVDQFNISIVRNARSHGIIAIRIRLVAKDPIAAAAVTKAVPRLKDAFQRYLTDYANRRPPGMIEIDLDTIKNGLDREAKKIIEGDQLTAILFRQAQFTAAR